MVSPSGSLVTYEYGLRGQTNALEQTVADISSEIQDTFAQDFSAYVRSKSIADIVSLKDKSCINGGEYVVPGMRVLFRVPMEAINLKTGSGMLESNQKFDNAVELDANYPAPTDGHVIKTRETTGGTIAYYYQTTQRGVDAISPKEVPLQYTNAMWAAAKSEDLWALGRTVAVSAQTYYNAMLLCLVRPETQQVIIHYEGRELADPVVHNQDKLGLRGNEVSQQLYTVLMAMINLISFITHR